MRRSIATLAASLLGVAACQDGPPTDVPAESSELALAIVTVSGDSQIAEVGRLLERFLVFRVTDGAGRPVAGLRVEWEVVAGGGKVSGKRHETDVEGLAAGNFTMGPAPGKNVARAVVQDSLEIEFTAFALPPSPDDPSPSSSHLENRAADR
jgi:hypothetical protein